MPSVIFIGFESKIVDTSIERVTLFGQLFFGQLNLANYFMQIRVDFEGLII